MPFFQVKPENNLFKVELKQYITQYAFGEIAKKYKKISSREPLSSDLH